MPRDKDSAIQHAREVAAQGQLDQAIAECRKILKHFPDEPQVYLCIADLSLKNQLMAEAAEAYIQAATFFCREDALVNAISCYRQVLKIESSRPEIWVALGELHGNRGQVNNAVADYLEGAKSYVQNGSVEQGLETYKKVLELNPKNTCARLRVAELSFKQGLSEQAIEQYLIVADQYEKGQKEAEARTLYELILQRVPHHAKAARRLSRVGSAKADESDFSLKLQDRGEVHVPNDLSTVTNGLDTTVEEPKLAEMSSGNGANHEDIVLDAMPEGDMLVPETDHVLGHGIPTDPFLENATREQDEELPVSLSDDLLEELDTQYELALAYKDMGLLDEAIETFERAVTSPNRFLDSCTMLAACYKDRRLNKLAIQWLERASRSRRCEGPLALYVKHTLAQLYEAEGSPEKAAQLYASIPAIRQAAERLRMKDASRSQSTGNPASSETNMPGKTRRISFF